MLLLLFFRNPLTKFDQSFSILNNELFKPMYPGARKLNACLNSSPVKLIFPFMVTVFVDPPNLSDPRAIPEYNKRFMNFIYTLANAGVPDSEGGAKGYMNAYIKANALPDALTYRPTGSPPLYSFFTLNNQ